MRYNWSKLNVYCNIIKFLLTYLKLNLTKLLSSVCGFFVTTLSQRFPKCVRQDNLKGSAPDVCVNIEQIILYYTWQKKFT